MRTKFISMLCKCCGIKEANKDNTHYLTDSIIRPCLNEGGSNKREKGYMFDISLGSFFTQFSFQRSTSTESLQKALGREPSEAEINEAKKNAYAVDRVFCTDCEKLFGIIEEEFITIILPRLRGNDLTGTREILFEENIIIRNFFLLQVWRTSVARSDFQLSSLFEERLHSILFDPKTSTDQITSIPLNVTYLNTLGEDIEYTKNMVGLGIIDDVFVVFFNDFIIQVFPSIEEIKFVDIYGVNDKETFKHFTNFNEVEFVIKVINNTDRQNIFNLYIEEKRNLVLSCYRFIFSRLYFEMYRSIPDELEVNKFIDGFINDPGYTEVQKYSLDHFINFTNQYFGREFKRSFFFN